MRAPRPWPSRRRASSSATSSVVTRTPAGTASTTPTRAGPWGSRAVTERNLRPVPQTARRGPGVLAGTASAGGAELQDDDDLVLVHLERRAVAELQEGEPATGVVLLQ